METQIKVTYDQEFDTLYLYRPGIKPKGAIEIGDFILEFTQDMQKVAAIEILNATKVLSEVFGRGITSKMLSHIVRGWLRTVHKPDAVYVVYAVAWRIPSAEEEHVESMVTVPLMVKA